jgi:hypothetical protein
VELSAREGVPEEGCEALAHAFLGAVDFPVQPVQERASVLRGERDASDSTDGAAQVSEHEHVALIGKEAADGTPAEGEGPLDEVDAGDRPLVIDADELKVVEQAGGRRAESVGGRTAEGLERLHPPLAFRRLVTEGGLESLGEPVE